jgi:hypothetical protein
MNKELIEKYDKKTEQVLKDSQGLPLTIAIIIALAMFAVASMITKSLIIGAIVMLGGGALIPVCIYYAFTVAICNLAQNYKNNK